MTSPYNLRSKYNPSDGNSQTYQWSCIHPLISRGLTSHLRAMLFTCSLKPILPSLYLDLAASITLLFPWVSSISPSLLAPPPSVERHSNILKKCPLHFHIPLQESLPLSSASQISFFRVVSICSLEFSASLLLFDPFTKLMVYRERKFMIAAIAYLAHTCIAELSLLFIHLYLYPPDCRL